MTAQEFLDLLRRRGVRLWAEGDHLRYNAPRGVVTAAARGELARHKAAILTILRQSGGTPSDRAAAISRVSHPLELPLSSAQERLWVLDQLDPDSPAYNIPLAVRITGPLNADVLERSTNEIVRRHQILRTTCSALGGKVVQRIAPAVRLGFPVVDLQELPTAQREAEALRLATEEARRPFDLARGPLLRGALLRLGQRESVLLLTMHHFVADGWSMEVFYRELSVLYKALSAGKPSPLPELPVQYADFVHWQRRQLQGEALAAQLAYWKRQLGEGLPVLDLPTDRPRPAIQTNRGATHFLEVPSVLSEALRALSRREGVTLFMTLLASFQTLLHRYTRQDDIVVATAASNRNRIELEGLIGSFANTLLIRTDLSGSLTFRELLDRVRQVTLEAYAHQDLHFEKLVEELQPKRDLGRNPLFQVMFSLHEHSPEEHLKLPGLSLSKFPVDRGTARFDLSLEIINATSELSVSLEYDTDLFDRSTIDRMAGHFQTLLEGIVADPDRPIATMPLLTDAERRRRIAWNNTRTSYPRDRCVHELFEAQARQTPDSIAVQYGHHRLTYGQLDAGANRLARDLMARGVRPEDRVAVCAERGPDGIVAQLAALKAGGAYLPLDARDPPERLAFMLQDARVPVVLTQEHLLDRLPDGDARIVCMDRDSGTIAGHPDTPPDIAVTPEHLAYVMYTSGSTGRPKGVAVPHRAVVRLVRDTDYVELTASDRVAQASNASFDAATFEIWGALLSGARLVGVPTDILLTPRDFRKAVRRDGITTLFVTTAVFNQLARDAPGAFRPLTQVLFGGEAVNPKSVRAVLADGPPKRLLHVYGPTESTTFTTWYHVRAVSKGGTTVPIGRPIANTTVHVLDEHLQPVPVGVPGELHIGGDGLARGYLDRPELTAERFIPDPFSDAPDARLYRTGDRVRRLVDGNVEFLGRIDTQIKLRGFRIEMGEIESALTAHPEVRDAVVVMQEDVHLGKYLVAYVVPDADATLKTDRMRAYLSGRLPDYMVPSRLVCLEQLPMTPSGKVDRLALPDPGPPPVDAKPADQPPRNAIERQLARVFKRILDLPSVGVEDSFFELGGHSLLAVRLIAEIEKTFSREVALAQVFLAPTVARLAEVIGRPEEKTRWKFQIPLQPNGSRLPFFWLYGSDSNAMLPALLGPDQPLYGMAQQGEDGRRARHRTVEQIASHGLTEIRSVQPTGPYLLGGYCFGALVAFEMAQQLCRSGEAVPLLFLVETPGRLLNTFRHNDEAVRLSRFPRLARHLRNLRPLGARGRMAYVLRRTRRMIQWHIVKRAKWRLCESCVRRGRLVPPSLRADYVTSVHHHAGAAYHPVSYSGRIVICQAVNHSTRPTDGGGSLVGNVAFHPVPNATHFDIIRGPHVAHWAEQLARCLREVRATGDGPREDR